MWKIITKNGALVRAVSVVSALAVLVTGVTFAALQTQQVTLTGNSIQTAIANLVIGTASATSSAYSNTHSGFSFTGVVPGGPAVPADGYQFFLKNNGNAPLALRVSVSSTPTNTSSVDLNKVSVIFTRPDTNTSQTATLQSLMDGFPSGGLNLTDPLNPATTGTAYRISIVMAADAFTGTNATIGSIDFVFNGTTIVAS